MLFPTFHFLVFFTIVFLVYWKITQHRLRLGWLLLASAFFYMSFQPWLILLVLFSAAVDYAAAIAMEKTESRFKRRLLLTASICTNLGLLGLFKYANFFMTTAEGCLALLRIEWSHTPWDLALPLGISFYTFETISYIVDVYLGRTKAVRNPLDYGLFILFFPHLVAGPIVRPREFLPQIERPKHFCWNRMYLGFRLLLLGLFKKAVIADHLAPVVDRVFAEPGRFGSISIWLGVLGYAVQIYCDFSGYSDMALGLAHSLGFKLPVNFKTPYLSQSPVEFWQRWHISLSRWLRDYLYIPLGGNRGGQGRTYVNLIIVMALGGLWHGASWTFVAWGLFHGVWLALHRAVRLPKVFQTTALRPVCVLATFLLVCIGWVFFRAQSFADAGAILTRMAWPTLGEAIKPAAMGLVLLSLAIVFLGGWLGTGKRLMRLESRMSPTVVGATLGWLLILVFLLFPQNTKAFIYFQF